MNKAKYINHPYSILAICAVFFLLFCSFFWDQFPMSESVSFVAQSQDFYDAVATPWHPPIYLFILFISNYLLGGPYFGSYIVGALSVIISGWLILVIARCLDGRIWRKPSAVWLTLLGYFSLPLIGQGAFILDIDNTILTPVLLAIYFFYLKFARKPNWKTGFGLFLIIEIALWSKMTTPIILLGAFGLYHLIRLEFSFIFRKLAPNFLLALIVFYLSYGWLYTKYVLAGYGSFQFSGGKTWGLLAGLNTFQLPWRESLFSIVSNIGALAVWSSPFLVLIILYWIWILYKDHKFRFVQIIKKDDAIALAVPFIFIIFTIFSYTILLKIQASAGFPKYHYPLFSFLFLAIGLGLARTQFDVQKRDIAIWLASGLFYIFTIKDILFPFYQLGREQKLAELAVFCIKAGILLLAPVAVYVVIRRTTAFKDRKNILFMLCVFLIVSDISGIIWRVKADYSSNYHYGVMGTEEAIGFADRLPVAESIYFPFAGYFITQPGENKKSVFGRLQGSDFKRPVTDYIIMPDHLLYGKKFFSAQIM